MSWVMKDKSDETFHVGDGEWSKNLNDAHEYASKEDAEKDFDEVASSHLMREVLEAIRAARGADGLLRLAFPNIGDGALGQTSRKLGDDPVADVPRGAIVRIRTRAPNYGGAIGARMRPKGQDAHVVLVLVDGREVPIPNVLALKVAVDSRSDYVAATLVLAAELEIDATANVEGTLEEQLAYWKRFALRELLRDDPENR